VTVRVTRSFVLTLKNTKLSGKEKISNSKIKIKKIKMNKWKITDKKTSKSIVTVKVNRKNFKCKIVDINSDGIPKLYVDSNKC